MRIFESDTIELKREYTDEIKRTAIAFANTEGGTIFVGISDDGTVTGVDDADDVCLRIVSSLRSAVKPDITPFLKTTAETMEGKTVVRVQIGRGSGIPYYLGDKGLKPSGVFLRVGTGTVPANETHIRSLIKENDKDSFTLQCCLNQNLTFQAANAEFEKMSVEFGEAQMVTLGLLDTNKLYTNLGLLLSDQCEHTVKLAVFEGTSKAVFRDRKEFSGSLFKQMNEVFSYLELLNKVHATFEGLKRIDSPDYPAVALREALLNAIVHRDYGLSGSTFVNVYDDKLEILTLGGLVQGLNVEAIKQGYSLTRNEKLANVFYKLKLIEAYGTGIPRIMELYKNNAVKPEIDVTDSSFRIIFPNANYGNNGAKIKQKNIPEKTAKLIVGFIGAKGSVTRKEVMTELGITSTQAYNVLSALVEQGKIKSDKDGKTIKYLL